jgi:hypothetical protein
MNKAVFNSLSRVPMLIQPLSIGKPSLSIDSSNIGVRRFNSLMRYLGRAISSISFTIAIIRIIFNSELLKVDILIL